MQDPIIQQTTRYMTTPAGRGQTDHTGGEAPTVVLKYVSIHIYHTIAYVYGESRQQRADGPCWRRSAVT